METILFFRRWTAVDLLMSWRWDGKSKKFDLKIQLSLTGLGDLSTFIFPYRAPWSLQNP